MSEYGEKPFGLCEVILASMDGGSQVNLPAAQVLSFSERVVSEELAGKDATVALVTRGNGVEWSLGAGGISLEAYALMTGRDIDETGTTPNRVKNMGGNTPTRFPYFRIFGRSLGDGEDDLHCKIFKAKLTKAPSGQLENGKFWITSCGGVGVADSSRKAFEFVQNETATEIDMDEGGSGS